ncbi:MAG: M23 family metallopeptidase [Candidatus Colwellbacteria bacterium]|nr:M23 family metallopeptidase [Candidatus Colwellbacteria bacterium]
MRAGGQGDIRIIAGCIALAAFALPGLVLAQVGGVDVSPQEGFVPPVSPKEEFLVSQGPRQENCSHKSGGRNVEAFDFIASDPNGSAGKRVSAVASGTILRAGREDGYGNYVLIRHPNEVVSLYAHLGSFGAAPGSCREGGCTIARGEEVGRIGNTGVSSGAHLHFSFFLYSKDNIFGTPLSAMNFLPELSRWQRSADAYDDCLVEGSGAFATLTSLPLLISSGAWQNITIATITPQFERIYIWVSEVYTWALGVAGLLAFVMISYAGVRYTMAAGDPERVKAAKDTIMSAIWGLLILLAIVPVLYALNPCIIDPFGESCSQLKTLTLPKLPALTPGVPDSSGNAALPL